MKRALTIAFMLLIVVCVCLAESVPNGECADIITVEYDGDLFTGWKTMLCPDTAGMLFSAYTDAAEITVSVDEIASAGNAEEFLKSHLSNVSRYGRVIASEGPFDWKDEGAGVKYSYQYLSGSDKDDVYMSRVYAEPYSYGYYAIFSVNCWGADAEEVARRFEEAFLPSVRLETLRASAFFTAYLKETRTAESGRTEVTLDFCEVAFDPEIFTIYASNPDPTEYRYELSENATVYLPDAANALYSVYLSDGSAGDIQRATEADDGNGIYRALFGEDNEILWLMHYNAF